MSESTSPNLRAALSKTSYIADIKARGAPAAVDLRFEALFLLALLTLPPPPGPHSPQMLYGRPTVKETDTPDMSVNCSSWSKVRNSNLVRAFAFY